MSTEATESTPGMSSREPESSYRPMSLLAVTSFCLAVLSPMAFATIWLWVLPPVAVVVAVFACWKLEQARAEYAGQVLAKLSLVIALCAGFGVPTKYFVERFVILRDGQEVANAYLDLILANNVKKAFFLSRDPLARAGMQNNIDQLITRSGDTYRAFLGQQEVKFLGGRGAEAQVTRLPATDYGYRQGFYEAKFGYRIALEDIILRVEVSLRGGVAKGGDWKGRQWWVTQVVVRREK